MHERLAGSRLSHQQRCRRSDLVGNGDLGDAQRPAEQIRRADETDKGRKASRPERNADDAIAPRAAKAVVDENSDIDA